MAHSGALSWHMRLLFGLVLVGLAEAYVVPPTSQHVLQLAARRAASPPPRALSTLSNKPTEDDVMRVRLPARPVCGGGLRGGGEQRGGC